MIDVDAPEAALLPLALAQVHRDTPVGARVVLRLPVVDNATALVAGAGFDVGRVAAQHGRRCVHATRARTLPDVVGPGMRVLVCGLNPSLVAADAGYGYAGPTNRFWPAAVAAGLVCRPRDPLHALAEHDVGMTDLVKRATPGAGVLTPEEYRAGAQRVTELVGWLRPALVLFVGLAGWRAAVDRRAVPGLQPAPFGGSPAYVMPSTSGLNAHSRISDLTAHMAAAREAATSQTS
jgi:double-stranded uracil-DNA glycosylase